MARRLLCHAHSASSSLDLLPPAAHPTPTAGVWEDRSSGQPWSAWEDSLLLQGIEVWGRHPCKVATLVGSRSCAQVADRMQQLGGEGGGAGAGGGGADGAQAAAGAGRRGKGRKQVRAAARVT